MASINNNETAKNNDTMSKLDQIMKLSKAKKKLSSLSQNKIIPTDNDKKIIDCINMILNEYNIQYNQILNIPITSKYPFNGFLFSYAIQKTNKSELDNLYLIHFLKFYDSFNNLLDKIYNDEEKIFLFSQLISKINIEKKNEKEILFKVGDYSEKFHFLLNGTVTRLITYKYEAIMDKHEYYIYMKYIYKLDEIELFNLIVTENEEVFDKFELLHFILGDKNVKYHADALKQLRNMEASYISQRLFANKLNENNFNNSKTIILSEKRKKLDDILKGDYIVSCSNERIKNIKVPIEEYINNLKPINFEEENEDLVKKRIILYSYKIEKEIEVGEHIEELDENKIIKKISTIICNNNCIFGYFIKKDFLNCLKVTQTKFHRNDINFLLGNELFSSLNFQEFDRNYYKLFELIKTYQKQMLFSQGEANDYIYFLKKGEVSVSLEGNINDLYRIIGLKGGIKNRKLLDVNYIKRFYSINFDDNFFVENKNFSLFKVNENFPIGLEDFLDEENGYKQLFNAYCNMDSEVLAIKKDNLTEITYREKTVYRTLEKYIIKRKNLLIDKINGLKNGLIQKYIYEKYKVKIILPDLFDESPLSPKKNKNIERVYMASPKRKNDLLYIDTKLDGKSFREITSALKLKEKRDLEELNNEQNETNKNNTNEDDSKSTNNDNNNNNEKTMNEGVKTENNNDKSSNDKSNININNSINKSKFRKRKSVIKIKNDNKINKEILELIKSPNFNQMIRLNKNKKLTVDPLDKIYKELKFPSITNSKSIKNFPSLTNKNNYGYEITSFKVLSPLKPHKFIPKDRKIILPEKYNYGYFNKKMKEIKMLKTISQDKSSVILKTEISPHDLYYDRNNRLISTIHFDKFRNKKKEKKKIIFNNIRINQSLNYKSNKSIEKKENGTNIFEINKGNNDNEKSLLFPKIL